MSRPRRSPIPRRALLAAGLVAAVAVAAVAASGTGPGPAEPGRDGGGGRGVWAELSIEVDLGDGLGHIRRATLRCGGGAALATGYLTGLAGPSCAELDARRQLLASPGPEMCTQVYGGPEQASVRGELDGRVLEFSLGRSDGCGIAKWEALEALLGPPAGHEGHEGE